MKKIEVLGLQTIPKIKQGDNLAQIVNRCAKQETGGLSEKDIIVLTSKIVSKAQGLVWSMEAVVPGKKAIYISKKTGKDAKWLQLIFDQGDEILAIVPLKGLIERHILGSCEDRAVTAELVEHEQALCITVGTDGRLHTCDAGIDGSNHEQGTVSLLPRDPDAAAKRIREKLQRITGKKLAVILADTEILPFGTMDFALGSSGIRPVSNQFGREDLFGKPKFGGMDLIANELTCTAALAMGQLNESVPAVIIRGFDYEINETENVSNCLLPNFDKTAKRKMIRDVLRATSYATSWPRKLLLRVISWFI